MRGVVSVPRNRVMRLIFVILAQLQDGNASSKLVCYTPACRRLGEYYRENMAQNGSACNDFYDYVCRNWEKNYPRPKYESYWSVDGHMQDKTYRELKNILEEKSASKDTQVERAKVWYKACRNIPSLKRFDSVEIKKFLPRREEWPMFSPKSQISFWKIDNHYLKLTGESALFDITVDADPNEHEFATKLNAIESPYGLTLRYLPWVESVNDKAYWHYKAFLTRLVKAVVPNGLCVSDEKINREIIDVIQFREILRKISSEVNGAFNFYSSIEKFQRWYDTETNFIGSAKINFLEQVRAIYKDPMGPHSLTIEPNSTILYKSQYFEKLVHELVLKSPPRIIANHIHLYFLERHFALDKDMKVELERSIVRRRGLSDLPRYEVPRWKKCFKSLAMSVTLSRIYIRSFFSQERKNNVERLLEEAKEILREQISRSNWLDARTKRGADYKLKQLRSAIGYTDIHKDDRLIALNPWPMAIPTKVDALNSVNNNFLFASASYLQWPIYIPNGSFAVDYGSVVGILGHELHHGFDIKGVPRDHTGAESTVWTDNMVQKYNHQASLLHAKYNELNNQEFERRNKSLNGVTMDTFNEDLADTMGLKVAYLGFASKLKEAKGYCPVLGGFEDFDCRKLFFISFASSYCDGSAPNFQQLIVLNGGYSFPSVRVNGAVANLKEFSQAFGCKPGHRLAFKSTYDFWQIQ